MPGGGARRAHDGAVKAANLTTDLLLHAYSVGIFPMSESRDDTEIFWVEPKWRGLLPLDGFHISRSLARQIRGNGFGVTLDRDFDAVVHGCADRDSTWINAGIARSYGDLHRLGHAHSIEIWDGADLVGGVYGVVIGAAFFGESMFSRRTGASKVALAYLTAHLARQGFVLFDTQFLTPHLASLGGIEISRDAYQARLRTAVAMGADFAPGATLPSAQEVVQLSAQTS